tara:strand:+ start:1035 stop:2123 length:1089 start_codon:yes stop_codon:yes gene_type:complete
MYQNSIPNHTIKKIEIIDANYVFIDGAMRSGKNSLLPIVSSFNRVEHFKDRSSYDLYTEMYETGNLTKQGFNFMYANDLLLDVWFAMMGRDLNTNAHDLTSIMNSSKKNEYIKRLERKDTPDTFLEILKEVKKRQLIFPFVSNVLKHGDLLSEISKSFKYIIVMRNPIDLIFSQFRSGRGVRLGTDPRYAYPAFQIKGIDNLYSSMLNNAEEYDKANQLEKTFLLAEQEMELYMNSNIRHADRSCLVPIENYWIETDKYIKILENFLETSQTEFTKNEMLKAKIPRKIDIEMFSTKANMIFQNMNDKYVDRLKSLCQRYEVEISNVYKLNSIKKSEKNYKNLDIDDFSKILPPSRFNKGELI